MQAGAAYPMFLLGPSLLTTCPVPHLSPALPPPTMPDLPAQVGIQLAMSEDALIFLRSLLGALATLEQCCLGP